MIRQPSVTVITEHLIWYNSLYKEISSTCRLLGGYYIEKVIGFITVDYHPKVLAKILYLLHGRYTGHFNEIEEPLEKIIESLDAQNGEVKFKFKYFIDKKSPVTGNCAPMCYDCSFKGQIYDGEYKFILGVKVPITTLCPCSKEISDNGAHNQRAIVTAKISYDEDEQIWLEDLIEMIEECASCPLYPLLKREDEKYVTEKAWENPKFVEDVLRDVVVKFRTHPLINEFEVECEAYESIHNHSAWAYQKEVL